MSNFQTAATELDNFYPTMHYITRGLLNKVNLVIMINL